MPVWRVAALRHDAFEAEPAGVLEHGGAVRRLNVLEELDAISGPAQHGERCLA